MGDRCLVELEQMFCRIDGVIEELPGLTAESWSTGPAAILLVPAAQARRARRRVLRAALAQILLDRCDRASLIEVLALAAALDPAARLPVDD